MLLLASVFTYYLFVSFIETIKEFYKAIELEARRDGKVENRFIDCIHRLIEAY